MGAYLAAVWKCRFFWLSLVKMDLTSRYRGSVLGICWSLLHPIAMTAILCVVFKYAFRMKVETYAPLLFTGLTFWGFFSSVVVQGCGCFFQGESYIRQFPAPMAIYPLRTVLGSAFHFAIGLLLAISIALLAGPARPEAFAEGADGPRSPAQSRQDSATGKTANSASCAIPNSSAPAPESAAASTPAPHERGRSAQLRALPTLVPTLLLLVLFGWSVAILFGLLNVRFRDTRHLAEIGLQALFYMTPIMYPIQAMEKRFLGKLLHYNPLTSILDLLLQPILYGSVPSLTTYVTAGLIIALLSVAAIVALKLEERRLIFYL